MDEFLQSRSKGVKKDTIPIRAMEGMEDQRFRVRELLEYRDSSHARSATRSITAASFSDNVPPRPRIRAVEGETGSGRPLEREQSLSSVRRSFITRP